MHDDFEILRLVDERISVRGPLPHPQAYRLMETLGVEVVEPDYEELSEQQRGRAAVDYRASRANVGRRQDRGEEPVLCDHCQTEVDVTFPAHDPRCPNFPRVEAKPKFVQGKRIRLTSKLSGTTASHAKDGSKTGSQLRREQKEREAVANLLVRCGIGDCDWWFEGPAKIGMAMQTDHRLEKHPRVDEDELVRSGSGVGVEIVSNGAHPTPSTKVADGGWSRKQVKPDAAIATLKAKAAELGHTPTGLEWKRNHWRPAYNTYLRLFDSWAHALELAELSPVDSQRAGGKVWTRDALIAEIQRHAVDGQPPKADEFASKIDSIRREFGTWSAAVEAAGFKPRARGGQPGNGNRAAERQEVPVVWRIKVPGTGLRYRTVTEGWIAADEIEHDGERVADEARKNGQDGKADQALDASRELAQKIRDACDLHAETNGIGTETTAVEPNVHADLHEDRMQEPASIEVAKPEVVDGTALVVRALDATGDQEMWIEKMHAEAARLRLRADAFDTIGNALTVLKETEG